MYRILVSLVALACLVPGSAREFSLPQGATAMGLAWSPDGSGIAVLYRTQEGTTLELLDLPAGTARWRVPDLRLPSRIQPLAFSPAGERLAVGERPGIVVLSASEGAVVTRLELEEFLSPVAISFRPDGALVAVVEELRGPVGELHLVVWGPAGEEAERLPLGKRSTPTPRPMADFSPDGRYLAYAAGTAGEPGGEAWLVHLLDLASGELRSWDLRELVSPELREEVGKDRFNIASVAVHPEAREIAVGLYSSSPGNPLLLRLEVAAGALAERYFPAERAQYMVHSLAYGPGGDLLVFSGKAATALGFQTLGLLNLAAESPPPVILCRREPRDPEPCAFHSPAFSPDGRILALLWRDTVRLWDLCPGEVSLPDPGWSFSYSSGGAYIPTGEGEWQVRFDGVGNLWLAHQVGEAVESFGPFRLSPEENAGLWALIEGADLFGKASSTRLGIPDEARSTFRLVGPTCVHEITLWEGDVWEDPALVAILARLAALIEAYTGEEPRL
jgi:WD40 repeat protein